MNKYIISFAMLLFLISCGGDKEPLVDNPSHVDPKKDVDPKKSVFSRKAMLSFWANDLIIPAYEDYILKTTKLEASVNTFVSKPTVANLKLARTDWKNAYISWQKVSFFQIGKAEEIKLTSFTNVYPTNTANIKLLISKGTYDLTASELYDAQGLPALDYLLNGFDASKSDDKIVKLYISNAKNGKFLKTLAVRLNELALIVKNDWKASFKTAFIDNDGTSQESSVDVVVNYYVIPFFEKQLRDYKIVVPLGKNNDGNPLPKKTEAYFYGKLSKTLYLTALDATINFFNGTSYDGTKKGQSLQQYLVYLKKDDLVKEINGNLAAVKVIGEKFGENLSEQVDPDSPEKRKLMHNSYDMLQKVLRKFKPDMMSAMGITNTSTDTDND